MGAIKESSQFVDIVCQHNTDGSIIPMRIRIADEDGQHQTYTIHSYKELASSGDSQHPDSVVVTSHTRAFQCNIRVFGQQKPVRLLYNAYENSWRLSY